MNLSSAIPQRHTLFIILDDGPFPSKEGAKGPLPPELFPFILVAGEKIHAKKNCTHVAGPHAPFISQQSGSRGWQAEKGDALAPLPVLKSRLLNLPQTLSILLPPTNHKKQKGEGKSEKTKWRKIKGAENNVQRTNIFKPD